jgi:hypothetical protein
MWPSICGATISRKVWFWLRQLCAIISRAGATFREMNLASTQMYASRMLLVMAMRLRTGAEIFGQSPRKECVLRIAGMRGATTTWLWKSLGARSRSSAIARRPSGISSDACAILSRQHSERSPCSHCSIAAAGQCR